jgi:MerR family regulatory protein
MTESSEGLVRIADVAQDLGLSPSRIRQLADADVIPSSRTPGGHRLFNLGAVRAAIARRTLPQDPLTAATEATPSWQQELTLLGLAEDIVWRLVAEDLQLDRNSPAGKITGYAFTEMLNNAIDPSGSETATIK